MKFVCLKDLTLFGKKMVSEGDIVEINQVITNGTISINLDETMLSDSEMFLKLNKAEIITRQYQEETENIEKDWIIELKVKTTRTKLREIEDFLRIEIEKLLN
jgi:hypothetical protein